MVRRMRVVTQDRFGGPEVLYVADRAVPEPGLTEVRVRVMAAGVNPVDVGTRAGRGVADVVGPPPFVLGWDVAGIVDAIAPGVTRFKVGDEVFGMPRFPHEAGAYAEYVTAPARHFARKPSLLDFPAAAALPLAGLTAWQALVETCAIEPGQTVLVHGAAGGVGQLAVQLAHARGAKTVATARADRLGRVADLGCGQVFDYQTFDLHVRDIDVVLDLIGGDCPIRSIPVLRRGGVLVYIRSDLLPENVEAAAAAAGVRATAILVEPDRLGLEGLAQLVNEGLVVPEVGGCFPLDDAAHAHEVAEARHVGKIVLTIF